MRRIVSVMTIGFLTASPAFSGAIEDACMQSDRRQVSAALCACIQDVADQRLSSGDQKEAAKFFEDPQLAQETRMSDNPSKERFWERYKDWTEAATKSCG